MLRYDGPLGELDRSVIPMRGPGAAEQPSAVRIPVFAPGAERHDEHVLDGATGSVPLPGPALLDVDCYGPWLLRAR